VWAALPLEGFGLKEIAAWASERRQTVSGGTLLHELSTASTAVKWAEGEGILEGDWNPFLSYRRKRVKNVPRKRRTALNEDELRSLAEVAAETEADFYPLFLAAVSTGWRLGDLTALEHRDVDLPTLKTRPEAEKRGYAKVAYASPQLADWLRSNRATPRSLVFTRNGKA